MTPAPDLRLAQDHEAGDLVDRVVHPFGLEGGAVAALVPAAVGRRTVEHAIDEKERNRRPASPEPKAEPARNDEGRKPDQRVADRRSIVTAHQLLEFRARDPRRIPLRRSEPGGDGPLGFRTHQAVVAADESGHRFPPRPTAKGSWPPIEPTANRKRAAAQCLTFIFYQNPS